MDLDYFLINIIRRHIYGQFFSGQGTCEQIFFIPAGFQSSPDSAQRPV